jgi:hypothetical protein
MPSRTRPQEKNKVRPDLQLPKELRGTITGATDKLQWLERVDACIAAGMVPRSFLHVAVRIATQWLNKETGLTWRSAENLASDIGMAKSSVEGLLEAAVATGLLIIVKRGQRGRGKRSTIYRPAMPDLLPDGPGFKPGLLIPDGPGFKRRRKSRLGQPANPGFGPNIIPAHRDDLPEEVIPEDIIPAADTARGDSSNTARAVRETVPEPLTPVPRADARTEPITAQQPKPTRDNPIGTAPKSARAAFAEVKFAWPSDRTDDEGIAYAAYVAALAAAQGDADVVLDAIWERIEESGAGHLPWLSDALRRIERDLRTRQARKTSRQ